MTARITNLMAQINATAIRGDAQDRREHRATLAAAICLSGAVLLLVSMALHVAVNIDTLAGQAIAARGM